MKMIVVGYGSMGKRRIRLLRRLKLDTVFICVDSNPARLSQIEKDGYIGYADIDDALKKEGRVDIGFVCTSPGNHADIILKLINAGIHVFTELNLTNDRYELIERRADELNVKVFMSCTLLFRKQMQIISGIVRRQNKPLTYIYHVGQYLPDWHPWESYKDFFAGCKETNGVKELFAIQLPWMIEAFGKVKAMHVAKHRCTSLAIDFSDSVSVTFQHVNGSMGVFIADVVSRKAMVRLEIFGEDAHILWNGHNDDLYVLDIESGEFIRQSVYDNIEQIPGYSDNIIENQYMDEMKCFLDVVYENAGSPYSLKKDTYILSLIDQIEAAV